MNKIEEVLVASSKRWWTGKKGFDYAVSDSEQDNSKERLKSVLSELRASEETPSAKADSPVERWPLSME